MLWGAAKEHRSDHKAMDQGAESILQPRKGSAPEGTYHPCSGKDYLHFRTRRSKRGRSLSPLLLWMLVFLAVSLGGNVCRHPKLGSGTICSCMAGESPCIPQPGAQVKETLRQKEDGRGLMTANPEQGTVQKWALLHPQQGPQTTAEINHPGRPYALLTLKPMGWARWRHTPLI